MPDTIDVPQGVDSGPQAEIASLGAHRLLDAQRAWWQTRGNVARENEWVLTVGRLEGTTVGTRYAPPSDVARFARDWLTAAGLDAEVSVVRKRTESGDSFVLVRLTVPDMELDAMLGLEEDVRAAADQEFGNRGDVVIRLSIAA